ncbi:MAG: GAF domain-containing SpoIIE family protein phosphatase, partial [Candidatus Nanopelagicales bacterium]
PANVAIVLFAAAPLCGALALPILVSRSGAEKDDALRWFACGLVIAVAALTLHLISFPIIVSGRGPFDTGDQGNSWLYLLVHLALALGTLAAVVRLNIRWCPAFLVVGLGLVACAAVDWVPPLELLGPDQEFTQALITMEIGAGVLVAVGLAAWVKAGGRSPTPLRGWVSLTLLLVLYEIVLRTLSDGRFDASWWASLTMRAAAFLVLAFGCILAVTSQLQRFEGYSERELSRRESQLHQSIAVGDQMLTSATALAAVVRPYEVAKIFAESVRSTTGLAHVRVVDLHPTHIGTRELYSYNSDGRGDAKLDGLLSAAMHGTAVLWPEAASDPVSVTLSPGVASQLRGFATVVALPLRVGGLVIGALVAVDTEPRAWSPWSRELVQGLTAQAGPALSRARLFEREHQTAEALQQALLPERLPTVKGVQLAGRYVAGQSGVHVGGDWYDCIERSDGRLCLIVGDVMGKGLKAATLMGRLREASRVLVSMNASPAAVLDGLNDVVLAADTDQIATAACLLLNPSGREVTVAVAGHPPPIVISPNEKAKTIGDAIAMSPLLGLAIPTSARAQIDVSLHPYAGLVLYTDGLVEDKTGISGGLARLLNVCDTLYDQTIDSEDFAAALLSSQPAGQEQPDDIALLVALLRAEE